MYIVVHHANVAGPLLSCHNLIVEACTLSDDKAALKFKVQGVSRIIMRLRSLISKRESEGGSKEEVAALAWTLADLADYMDNKSKEKLESEPLLAELEHCYEEAASPAYHRLSESLQLLRWGEDDSSELRGISQ